MKLSFFAAVAALSLWSLATQGHASRFPSDEDEYIISPEDSGLASRFPSDEDDEYIISPEDSGDEYDEYFNCPSQIEDPGEDGDATKGETNFLAKSCWTSEDCDEGQCCISKILPLITGGYCEWLSGIGEKCNKKPQKIRWSLMYDYCPCISGLACVYKIKEGEIFPRFFCA